MRDRVRILITGFGPFPGAPFNPTMPLVDRLTRLRRVALDEIELAGHIFRVSYQAVDQDLPGLIERLRPKALLMFGLSDRTAYLRVETCARNALTVRLPDADGHLASQGAIVAGEQALRFGPHTGQLLRAARATGIDARLSRDAGSYLCNYLSWRALQAARRPDGPYFSSFIHVPLVAGPLVAGLSRPGASRITLDKLVDAGEAMLIESVRIARQAMEDNDQQSSAAVAWKCVDGMKRQLQP